MTRVALTRKNPNATSENATSRLLQAKESAAWKCVGLPSSETDSLEISAGRFTERSDTISAGYQMAASRKNRKSQSVINIVRNRTGLAKAALPRTAVARLPNAISTGSGRAIRHD